jgi:hypothetical protein
MAFNITGFLGFQVGDITIDQVLYTLPTNGFTRSGNRPTDPGHNISLSFDEKELHEMDTPNSYIHVFDVSGIPASTFPTNTVIPSSMQSNQPIPRFECVRVCAGLKREKVELLLLREEAPCGTSQRF